MWLLAEFALGKVINSIPELSTATMEDVVTGTEAFSPDRHWIVGQVPEVSQDVSAVLAQMSILLYWQKIVKFVPDDWK